jgi:hypothetical protein
LMKTTCQDLLLLVGFDTLIYWKYYDTPPILVGHQDYFLVPLPGSEALLKSGIGKGNCRWISCHKNTGYHATDPKDSNAGGWTCEILDRNEARWRKPRLSDALRTAERETEIYPGSGPSWWGKTPTSCLLVLRRDTSRGVQGLGYKALAGQRLKNLRAQLAAWRRWRSDPL